MSFMQVGIGIVSEDKPSGEHYADIFLLENSMLGGRDINKKEKEKVSITLVSGQLKQLALDENFKVKAKWLKMGDSNRMTPPDLTKEQHVMIYQKPGYDEYYWVKIFEELDKANQETVTYAWGNKPKDSDDNSAYLENAYRLSLSTHEGEVRFATTKANEEQASYNIVLDTKNGVLGMKDDLSNHIFLDSVKGNLNIGLTKDSTTKVGENQNSLIIKDMNTQIDGNQNIQLTGALTMVGKDSINHSVKGDYNIESSQGCNLKIVSDIQAKTMGGLKIQAGSDVHIVTNGGKAQIVSASEITLIAPMINLVGVINAGVVNCSAMNMGAPPPTPGQVVIPNIEAIDKKPVEDAVELIKQETDIKEEEEEDNQSSNKEESKKEEEKDPWENESQAPEPEEQENPDQAVSTMKKEAVMNADQGMTINSNAKIILNSKGKLQLKGTTGIAVEGVTGDITDLLEQIIDAFAKVGDLPITTPQGPSVPDARWAGVATTLKALLKSWKGS